MTRLKRPRPLLYTTLLNKRRRWAAARWQRQHRKIDETENMEYGDGQNEGDGDHAEEGQEEANGNRGLQFDDEPQGTSDDLQNEGDGDDGDHAEEGQEEANGNRGLQFDDEQQGTSDEKSDETENGNESNDMEYGDGQNEGDGDDGEHAEEGQEEANGITPHTHSRPLPLVVAPCLERHLRNAMEYISDICPPLAVSSQLTKLSAPSSGSAFPLVYSYWPRLLLCGGEGSGLDHLGLAILHELEKFPVHSLGLASLVSHPSAKTPEEAMVHIFGEARRTTPSILYLPHLDLWWETALLKRLRTVLLMLLKEFPSDLPVLLLATSSVPPAEVDARASSIFSDPSVYQLGKPSTEDRMLFFDRLIESASVPERPKASNVESGPNVSELKAKVEAEQHALRRLRMCLRDVCNRS